MGEPARILLVENDPRTAFLLGEMLRTVWGERLVLVHTEQAGDANRELTDHGATCVLLDLGAGELDASAVIQELRTAAPKAAIVVLCERADEELALQVLRAGAQVRRVSAAYAARARATDTVVTMPSGSMVAAPARPTRSADTPPKANRAMPSSEDVVPAICG